MNNIKLPNPGIVSMNLVIMRYLDAYIDEEQLEYYLDNYLYMRQQIRAEFMDYADRHKFI